MQEMEYLTNLSSEVKPFGMAGRQPEYEYQSRAFDKFKQMLEKAKVLTIDNFLLSTISVNKKGELVVFYN